MILKKKSTIKNVFIKILTAIAYAILLALFLASFSLLTKFIMWIWGI